MWWENPWLLATAIAYAVAIPIYITIRVYRRRSA